MIILRGFFKAWWINHAIQVSLNLFINKNIKTINQPKFSSFFSGWMVWATILCTSHLGGGFYIERKMENLSKGRKSLGSKIELTATLSRILFLLLKANKMLFALILDVVSWEIFVLELAPCLWIMSDDFFAVRLFISQNCVMFT